jgi:hypothetical protein
MVDNDVGLAVLLLELICAHLRWVTVVTLACPASGIKPSRPYER